MVYEDLELKAMSGIAEILGELDEDARMRVLHWIGNKFYKSQLNFSGNTYNQASSVDGLSISTKTSAALVSNLPDFIEITIGKKFSSLGSKEKVLVVAKYLAGKSGNDGFVTSELRSALSSLGEDTKHLATYLQRLKKDDRAFHDTDTGMQFTMRGNERFKELSPNSVDVAKSGSDIAQIDEVTESTSPIKKKQTKRRPESIAVDKDFLRIIDTHTPNFTDYLKGYDLDKHKSASAFIAISVAYICNILGQDKASLIKIATCFKHSGKTAPDYLRQSVIDTANKQGFVFYTNPDDITLRAKGQEFVNSAKI